MNKKFLNHLSFVSLLIVLLASCKVTQPYLSPAVQTDGLFRSGNSADTNSIVSLPWKEVFTDTILQQLIDKGIASNLDLQIAYTRIEQSRAYYEQSRAAFL